MRLLGKTAIITGGGRGIGRAIALAFAKEGANIVLISRTLVELDAVVEEIKQLGRNALAIKGDVSSSKDVKDIVLRTLSEFKRIDILVNNAGIAFLKNLLDTSEEEWNRLIGINLTGAFLFSKAVLSVMIKQKSGVIINISSGAGKSGYEGLSAYCASKFGLIGLTESLASEVEKQNIRVYVVCPGGVDTQMYSDLFPGTNSSLLIRPEKIAQQVLELCLSSCKVGPGSSVEVYY